MKKFMRIAAALMAAVVLMTSCGGVDPSKIDYIQLRAPEEGSDIAIIDTSLGEITIQLYTEQVPAVVDNFKALVEKDFFDNQIIYQIVPSAGAALFGSSARDGNGADTKTGRPIRAEYSDDLWPFSGSVCAMVGEIGQLFMKKRYFDSRSFIIGDVAIDEETHDKMVENYFPAMMMNAFEEMGGAPGLARFHTVFGKVIQGMDIVNQIQTVDMERVPADTEDGQPEHEYEAAFTPVEDIVINDITLSTFHADDYPVLDNTLTEDEIVDLVNRSEIDQAAIDEAIKDGTYGQSEESSEAASK